MNSTLKGRLYLGLPRRCAKYWWFLDVFLFPRREHEKIWFLSTILPLIFLNWSYFIIGNPRWDFRYLPPHKDWWIIQQLVGIIPAEYTPPMWNCSVIWGVPLPTYLFFGEEITWLRFTRAEYLKTFLYGLDILKWPCFLRTLSMQKHLKDQLFLNPSYLDTT